MEIFYVLTKYVQSRLLQNCRMRERVKCRTVDATISDRAKNIKTEILQIFFYFYNRFSLVIYQGSFQDIILHDISCVPTRDLYKTSCLTLSHIQQICSSRLREHLNNNMDNLPKWRQTYWMELKNIVSKGEIAHFEQFLLLSQSY